MLFNVSSKFKIHSIKQDINELEVREGKYVVNNPYASSSVSSNNHLLWENNYGEIFASVIGKDNGQDIYYVKGTYTLTFYISDDVGNKSSAFQINVVVQPRRLTITFMNGEKIYDGEIETFESCSLYNIEGLMGGDRCASIEYSVASTVQDVGVYTITPTSIIFEDGKGVLTENDRTSITSELSTLRDEIDRIATSTTFNGKKL